MNIRPMPINRGLLFQRCDGVQMILKQASPLAHALSNVGMICEVNQFANRLCVSTDR